MTVTEEDDLLPAPRALDRTKKKPDLSLGMSAKPNKVLKVKNENKLTVLRNLISYRTKTFH
jgi:hypothetical protein